MKKLFLIASIVMASVTMVQAQECDKQCDKQKGNAPSFAQKQTNDMVALYNLNDKQAKELLALNEEFEGKMHPMMRPPMPPHHQKGAPHKPHMDKKQKPGHECKKGEGHECKKGEGHECKKGEGQECKKGEGQECKKGEGHECKKGEGHECKKGEGHECKKGEGHECKKGEGHECKKGEGHECKKGEGHECKKGEGHECKKGEGHECKKGEPGKGHHPMMHGKGHPRPEMNKEQMKKVQDEYDARLKKIMTSKQFKQYQKNKKTMK